MTKIDRYTVQGITRYEFTGRCILFCYLYDLSGYPIGYMELNNMSNLPYYRSFD